MNRTYLRLENFYFYKLRTIDIDLEKLEMYVLLSSVVGIYYFI